MLPRLFSSCSHSLAAEHGLFTAVASLVAKLGLSGSQASVVFVACGLSSCNSPALELGLSSCGMGA